MLLRKLTHQGTSSNASMRSLSFNRDAADEADAAPARRSWAEKWLGFDALLQLANTYYASRMALVTLTACLSMLFLSIFSADENSFWLWMLFQMANTLLGASALPSVCLYTVISMQPRDEQDETVRISVDDASTSPPREDRHTPVTSFAFLRSSFRDIETRLQPFLLKRSKMLRLCETVVVIQLVLLYFFILTTILIFWMIQQPLWKASLFTMSDGLGFLTIICVLLQTKEFDRLRAHEQLQLGVGLDQDQLDYATSFKKRPASSGRITTVLSPEEPHELSRSAHVAGHEGASPNHTSITLDLGHSSWVVEYELRRGLFEAAVNRDHGKARALLDVMERVLESKMKLELYLLKMYATPTLWFWSFAYTTHNPLHVACRLGDDVMAEILLKGGLHPDLLDKTQGAPFSFYELLQGRGKSSANVLASPLHVAVAHGHTNVIDVLVAHKANINIFAQTSFYSQSQRVPPIFLADSADVIATLIRHRANFLVVPGKGNAMSVTVLQRAMLNDRSDLEHVLKEWGADVALTPLHEASAMGDLPTVKHYLSLGIPTDQLGEFHDGVYRRTPLHWATIMGRHAVATELLAHKADVNALDARLRSPLHWAARHCHVETVAVLLQAGANPLQCDADGLTPLAFSAAGGLLNGPCVELFRLYGVDINAPLPTAIGDTCLHLALREGHQEAALALIQHGDARLASYNALGEPAIKCCASAEQLYAIKLISRWVDIVISYDSVYRQLAEHLKQGIEESYLTVSMRDAHADSAQHSMDAMRRASAVVCVLTPGFERNPVCMEELAFAKEHRVPVMAITIATMNLPEELQVYLFTRQLVPFRDAILASRRSSVPSPGGDETRELRFKLDDAKFKRSLQNLIDGLRDEVELHDLGLARAVGGSETGDHDDHDETSRSRSLYIQRTGTGIDSASISDTGERNRATSSPRTNRGGLFLGSNAKRRTLNDVVRDVLGRRRRSMVLPRGSRHPLQRTSVFLSHGDCHAEFVAKLQEELRRHEIPVTLDSISKVASMKERILAAKDAILQCDIFLVVLSEKSVKTELVSDQLAFAEDKGKHIVPIYYTRRPGLVDSTVKQLLEAHDRPVRIFGNGISYGRGFDELLDELRHEQELELQRQQDEMDGREWVPVSPAARQAVDLLLGRYTSGHPPSGIALI